MKILVILGNDKIAGAAVQKTKASEHVVIYIDRSTNLRRVIFLLKRGALSLSLIIKMAICEMMRDGSRPDSKLPGINSNADLLKAIEKNKPDRLILFRAGLIVNKDVIDTGVPVLNIHAATVPEYGGIGSIERAIKDGAYEQNASLHIVTSRIDEGEVVDKEMYRLNPTASYCVNESIAYRAAERLLLRVLHGNLVQQLVK